jgi:hypothetical protein
MTTQLALVLALGCVVASTVGAVPLVVPPDRRPTWSELGVAAGVGAGLLGVIWLLARLAVPLRFMPHLIGTLLAIVSGAVIWGRGPRLLPFAPPASRATLAGVVVAVCWMSPAIVGAALMSTGRYPAVFFHVDTPFRLTHVRMLLQSDALPPSSLSNAGIARNYHFGGPGVAAALSSLSGAPPHTAFFAFALPLALLGIGCAARLMAAAVASDGTPLHELLSAFILTAWSVGTLDLADAVVRGLIGARPEVLGALLATMWGNPETFLNHFADITVTYGRLFLMLSALPLVRPTPHTFWLGGLAVAALGQVRAGMAMIAAIVFGCACLVHAWRNRRVRLLWPAAAAAAGALLMTAIPGGEAIYPFQVFVQPLWMWRTYPGTLVNDVLAIVGFAVLPAALAMRGATGRLDVAAWSRRVAAPALAVVSVFGFYQLVGASAPELVWDARREALIAPFIDWIEPLQYMAVVTALLGAACVAVAWDRMARWSRVTVSVVIAVVTVLPLVHRVHGASLMALDPVRAHEYADNRALARALEPIPVRGSIVATNDLRYPADDSARDLLQYQLPAVWGHQAFAVPGYERYPGWLERVDLQRALASSEVPCSVLRSLSEAGVTHILIHTTVDHPSSLPLEVLHDGPEYVSYQLRGASLGCGPA